MSQRIDHGRAEGPANEPMAPAPARIEARPALVAALRFAGSCLDYHRMSELRRRAMCAPTEGAR